MFFAQQMHTGKAVAHSGWPKLIRFFMKGLMITCLQKSFIKMQENKLDSNTLFSTIMKFVYIMQHSLLLKETP